MKFEIRYTKFYGMQFYFNFLFIDLREKERNIDLLFHLFIYSLVDSCMCPDKIYNLVYWDNALTN